MEHFSVRSRSHATSIQVSESLTREKGQIRQPISQDLVDRGKAETLPKLPNPTTVENALTMHPIFI